MGDECQHSPLNYCNTVLHSLTRSFARDEDDSGLSIKYVVTGLERYRIGHQWHSITPGKFLVVNAHQSFQCRVEARQPVEGLCIYLDPALVSEARESWLLGHSRLLDRDPLPPPPQATFTEKLYALRENALGDYLAQHINILRDPVLRGAMDGQAFFLGLAEAMLKGQGENDTLIARLDAERKTTRDEVFRRVSLARQHMDEHFLEELNLDAMAVMAHFSKYHFLRCFKQVYGVSPYQYVLQKRLEAARAQLQRPGRSLQDIAVETGFGDRRAFNKAFRKAFGYNPAQVRA